ncbi:hypothetical protein VaNZ11_005717 [Volvox africanus]|uniref:MalT-like TPR region domain-containing protein n=1 Tax=Volvox africanus TaxID=51714 RepID=A0ABQ5RZ50_9CHLO|nr:hypothetical protein VaNZ11_005717 [Volvox africanus]
MDAQPLHVTAKAIAAPERRRGSLTAAIAIFGLGIASVSAAVTIVKVRSSLRHNSKVSAARKKVHTSARSGSETSRGPQRPCVVDSCGRTTPAAAASSLVLPSVASQIPNNGPYEATPLQRTASDPDTLPVPASTKFQSLYPEPPETQHAEVNAYAASTATTPVQAVETACSASVFMARSALAEASARQPTVAPSAAAPMGPSLDTAAGPPTAVIDFNNAAKECSSSLICQARTLEAEMQLLPQASATTNPNGQIAVRLQLPKGGQMAVRDDQTQATPSGAVHEVQHPRPTYQRGATDELALDLPAAGTGKAAVVFDDVGTALADQCGDLDASTLVSTALKVDDGGNGNITKEMEPQSKVEGEAEQLLLAATTAWNVHGNRTQGVKLAKRALATLQAGPHRAKYRSDVAASLADMLYGMNRWEEALEVVGTAKEAAREAGDWAMAIKLSNNMGAVYKKLGRISEAIALHRSCYAMAISELGMAHPLSLLARTNLTETLTMRKGVEGHQQEEEDEQEDKAARSEVRQLLQAALAQLEAEAGTQMTALEAVMTINIGDGPAKDGVKNGVANGDYGLEELPAAGMYRRTRTAIVRTHLELGRLEMMAGENPDAAEGAFRAALALCDELYGVDSRESGGPAFSLANCLRSIGKKDEARALYERLFDLIVQRNGHGQETAVHLARSLADLAEEADDWAAADKFTSAALHSMTLLIGTRTHPVLESFYQAACRAKIHNGDAAGAEALRRQYLTAMMRISQQQARNQTLVRSSHAALPGNRQPGATAGDTENPQKSRIGRKKIRK